MTFPRRTALDFTIFTAAATSSLVPLPLPPVVERMVSRRESESFISSYSLRVTNFSLSIMSEFDVKGAAKVGVVIATEVIGIEVVRRCGV